MVEDLALNPSPDREGFRLTDTMGSGIFSTTVLVRSSGPGGGPHCMARTKNSDVVLTPRSIARLRRVVRSHYRRHGRDLPWRKTRDPYRILVSEIMLQQTQVPRVLSRYAEFLRAFPTLRTLARAPSTHVLRVWQGLGYNRRAVALKRTAEIIVERYSGKIPTDIDALAALPGIGPATAAAVRAFAFNRPSLLIETNIRSVFLHHFFPGRTRVRDDEISTLVSATLDRRNPRTWYHALMDYGVYLKQRHPNPARRSATYTRQSSFEGSRRQLRAKLLRALLNRPKMTASELHGIAGNRAHECETILDQMCREGLLQRVGKHYTV
jgi:A/G-specific adenine glycosylase